jgi:hypothetical protein
MQTKKQPQIYQDWHYVVGGETISIAECRKLKPVNTYLWGDVFYHLYERSDGKRFIYSEWYSCNVASEGCFVQHCYI